MGNKCRYYGDKWSPRHKCNTKKLYTCEAKKDSDTSESNSNNEGKEESDSPNTEPEEGT